MRLFSRQAGMPLIFMQDSWDKLYDTVAPCDSVWRDLKKETVFPAFLRVLQPTEVNGLPTRKTQVAKV